MWIPYPLLGYTSGKRSYNGLEVGGLKSKEEKNCVLLTLS